VSKFVKKKLIIYNKWIFYLPIIGTKGTDEWIDGGEGLPQNRFSH
jgi:hypothetical protein